MNPLETVKPTLDEFFDRDPLSLSDSDLDATVQLLVSQFRQEREIWDAEKVRAKETGATPRGGSVKKLQKQALLERLASGSAKIPISEIKL